MKSFLGTPLAEYLPALGLLLLTIVYLVTAYGYSDDARAVPAGVAYGDAGAGGCSISYRARKQNWARTLMHWLNPAGDPEKREHEAH